MKIEIKSVLLWKCDEQGLIDNVGKLVDSMINDIYINPLVPTKLKIYGNKMNSSLFYRVYGPDQENHTQLRFGVSPYYNT